MKHIKLYENFQTLNEGVIYNDIIQLADREFPMTAQFGRPAWRKVTTPGFSYDVELTKNNVKNLNSDFAKVWLIFYPKANEANGGCVGEIHLNSFSYKKIITAQELAKISSVYTGPVSALIADIKDCYIGVCNGDARQVELMNRLKSNGWKEIR